MRMLCFVLVLKGWADLPSCSALHRSAYAVLRYYATLVLYCAALYSVFSHPIPPCQYLAMLVRAGML